MGVDRVLIRLTLILLSIKKNVDSSSVKRIILLKSYRREKMSNKSINLIFNLLNFILQRYISNPDTFKKKSNQEPPYNTNVSIFFKAWKPQKIILSASEVPIKLSYIKFQPNPIFFTNGKNYQLGLHPSNQILVSGRSKIFFIFIPFKKKN